MIDFFYYCRLDFKEYLYSARHSIIDCQLWKHSKEEDASYVNITFWEHYRYVQSWNESLSEGAVLSLLSAGAAHTASLV